MRLYLDIVVLAEKLYCNCPARKFAIIRDMNKHCACEGNAQYRHSPIIPAKVTNQGFV
ncbi:MAG: hypothetical protein LBJ41_00305 [Treponema sp.]|nr:hypothetical protein [Treponema sp.]